MKKDLEEILTVLDEYLGDTDPSFPEDWTEEDIKEEEPIFWICQKISFLLKNF